MARYERKEKAVNFRVQNAKMAREISQHYVEGFQLQNAVKFGLPEVDDRYALWRVPIVAKAGGRIGEIVIDAMTTEIDCARSTAKDVLENRLLGRSTRNKAGKSNEKVPHLSTLRNTVIQGQSETALRDLPEGSVDLVFTSPPYYNARPEYADYLSYEDYLGHMRAVIHECARVLNEGRFFVLNVSPVLIRRTSRNEASKRIAVPFDFHRLFIEEGFEFVDDIIWMKPEGAGWATGRGRRFSADRNPCQYKAVPVTEYVLVYRKKSDHLIDWLIRKHPNQECVKASKIADGYEVTNVWRITPAHSKIHPAIFPVELAEKVIRYYSFVNDVVLDPFGGIGTTAKAALSLNRRFAIVERDPRYIEEIKRQCPNWFRVDERPDVNWIGTDPASGCVENLFLASRKDVKHGKVD
jgi:DNA modification methylase